MKRLMIGLGFLLLICVDTFVQFGFKMAGERTLPVTLDLPWLERVANEPWILAIGAGYCAAFMIYITLIQHAPISDDDHRNPACRPESRECLGAARYERQRVGILP